MKKHNPTPYLNQPNSSRQHFTYAENQLLDQITRELVEGWKSDLRKLNSSYQKSLASSENIYRMSSMLAEKLAIVEEIIKEDSFKELYKQLTDRTEQINFMLNELNVRTVEIETIVRRLDKSACQPRQSDPIPDHAMKNDATKEDGLFSRLTKFFKRFGNE